MFCAPPIPRFTPEGKKMKILSRILSTSAAVMLLAASSQAFAQAVPSSAEASRVGGQIAPMSTTSSAAIGGKVSAGGALVAPKGAEKVKFTLKTVKVEGQTVYEPAAIEPLYADMLGKTVTLADIYSLADRLTAKYRNDGYILSQVIIPPQTIDGGTVRLQVVEGFVDQVSIQGSTQRNIAYLNGFADKIRAAKPLNSKTLERYLLLMNDLAGVQARAVLSPSPRTPGASDVTLIVSQKAYDAFMQIDNRGSRYLGPLQLNLGTRLNNITGFYEGVNFQVVTAPDGWPDRELSFGGITWSQPLNHEGTKLTAGASITSTHPGYTLSPFDVDGIAKSVNLELSHPFIRSRNTNLYAGLRFNYLDTHRNDNLGLGTTEDRLRVLRLNGTYQFADSLLGVNNLTAEISKGVNLFNASNAGDAGLTRANGDPRFFKGTAEITRTQRINQTFEAYAAATGQLSANTLLASEEFGVGGVTYGSAYDNSEITGENGVAGRLELRANNLIKAPVDFWQLYGFYDVGKVWDRDNAVATQRRRSLASAGAGTRININEHFAGTFELAVPLTREVETENDNNPRLFGSLTGKF